MIKFDLQDWIDRQITHNGGNSFLTQFGGAVAREVSKCVIRHKFETRPHTFTDGTKGEVAQKLTITLDFSKMDLQPHMDFENEFCGAVAEVVENNVNGLMENCESEDDDE